MEPFYMTFPMQNLFQTELEYEKDMERMKEMYPKDVARILAIVSDRCDELEFEGSRIYDENPDRLMLELEAQALYEKIQTELGADDKELQSQETVEAFSLMPPAEWLGPKAIDMPMPQQRRHPKDCDNWLCGMVSVLFQDELYRRRCRYRRCRRWW